MELQYYHWLGIASLTFLVLERLAPWHRPAPVLRQGWLRDLCFLLVNGHLFTLYAAGLLATAFAWTSEGLSGLGLDVDMRLAADWPLWLQFGVFLVLSDFIQWATHICLHRLPWLWEFHKVHHAIPRLDWAANFHFHWVEILVYKTTQAIPLALLGASPEATFWVYVAGTFWGHFNHANLNWGIGPLAYVFNSPRMHQWHHDASAEGGVSKNYAIVLSLWDWLFGTAHWPRDREPERLGYPGDEEMPQHLGGQMLWPLTRLWNRS